MRTATGLDLLVRGDFERLYGKKLGLLCNQASISHDFVHILDLLLPFHRSGKLQIAAVFGPQHGLFGHTQDNMIEWEGSHEARTGFVVHSLYGEHREPTPEMLKGIDLMLIDIQDVGSRYYTFVWSMALSMKACAAAGIPVMVLDRPNPIGGLEVEGNVLEPAFSSFVGLHPLPIRHGLTAGEVAHYVQAHFVPTCNLKVITMEGWSRGDYMDETDAPWSMPSPNMPTMDTALVYPGACLLEGTNLSEGRGTTRPFETFGAPFIDGHALADSLNNIQLPGVTFRPIVFEPTFNKHAEKLCEGCFVHVIDRRAFEPVLSFVAVLQEVVRQTGVKIPAEVRTPDKFTTDGPEMDLDGFAWRQPPYEYEYTLMPIDILAGNDRLRKDVECHRPLREIREQFLLECQHFDETRKNAMLYAHEG